MTRFPEDAVSKLGTMKSQPTLPTAAKTKQRKWSNSVWPETKWAEPHINPGKVNPHSQQQRVKPQKKKPAS